MKLARLLLCLTIAAACLLPAGRTGAAAPHDFLWKVTDGSGVTYLLGTIHVGAKDLYPLPAAIEESFKRSGTLVVELDPTQTGDLRRALQDIAKDGVYANGDSIANHISQATQASLAAYVRKSPLMPGYTHAKPWLLSLLIMQRQLKDQGLDSAQGLDVHFIAEAKRAKKSIVALESADFQVSLFSSLTPALQDQLLMQTLLEAADAGRITDAAMQAWRAGDPAAMAALITAEVRRHPFLEPVMHKLFDDRNAAMAKKIDGLLHTGKTYFVAVGAGHLVGEHGILNALRAEHYKVEQL